MNYPATISDTFDFGKHKGKTVEEVIDEEPTYIEWCIDNVTGFELSDKTFEYYQRGLEDYEENRNDPDWRDYPY